MFLLYLDGQKISYTMFFWHYNACSKNVPENDVRKLKWMKEMVKNVEVNQWAVYNS